MKKNEISKRTVIDSISLSLYRSASNIHSAAGGRDSGEGCDSHHDLRDVQTGTEGHVAEEREALHLQGQEPIPDGGGGRHSHPHHTQVPGRGLGRIHGAARRPEHNRETDSDW